MHGEGVSVGMMGAGRIAREMGMIGDEILDRQRDLLQQFSLPITAQGVDINAIRGAMSLDKKTVGGTNRWIPARGCRQCHRPPRHPHRNRR